MSRRAKRLQRRPLLLVTGLAILLPVVIMACFAPALAPYNPNAQHLSRRLTPPVWQEDGTTEHLLGTDGLGRDLLSRVIYGARVSLLVGVAVVVVSGVLGTLLGIVAGYLGGLVDILLMRLVDTLLAFPFLLLALALMAVLEPGLTNLILVLALTSWVPYARVARARTQVVRELAYVEASRSLAVPAWRILLRHVLPNVASSLAVIACFEVAAAMLAEATLSFLGLGVEPTVTTWGSTLNHGRSYLLFAWWPATIPGLAILLAIYGINLAGDGLREMYDPQLRR